MDFDNRKKGTVILLGAGPGDPGLLTIKGRAALAKADCIIYDRLASPKLLLAAKEGCELIYVGKADHHHMLPQDEINALLVEKAGEHALVVRLKGGDPYVFGRGGEEGIYLLEHGVDFTVIPGVTSAIAGPAAAGIPITHRGLAAGFHVMTAHGKEDRLTDIDFSRLTDEKETLVFLMGLRHVREIRDCLIAAGRRADTPAAVISHATTAEQRTCTGTLSDIAEKVSRAALTSPAIIVVGEVVSLSGQLAGQLCPNGQGAGTAGAKTGMAGQLRPTGLGADTAAQTLRGEGCGQKTYLVPYIRGLDTSRTSLAEMLRESGAAVIELPVGEIRTCAFELPSGANEEASVGSLDEAAGGLPSGVKVKLPDWLIFTSRNAVDGFFPQLREKGTDVRALCNTKIAAVGEKTVRQLKKYGLFADFVPTASNGRTLGSELAALAGQNASVWYIRGKDGGDGVGQAFCGHPHYRELTVYENREIAYDQQTVEELGTQIAAADGIFFTSASCAARICRMTKHLPREIYSIGPSCTKQLSKLGFAEVREASQTSYESLVECAQQITVHSQEKDGNH